MVDQVIPSADPPRVAVRLISSPSQTIKLPPASIVGSSITVKTIMSEESQPEAAANGKVCV